MEKIKIKVIKSPCFIGETTDILLTGEHAWDLYSEIRQMLELPELRFFVFTKKNFICPWKRLYTLNDLEEVVYVNTSD